MGSSCPHAVKRVAIRPSSLRNGIELQPISWVSGCRVVVVGRVVGRVVGDWVAFSEVVIEPADCVLHTLGKLTEPQFPCAFAASDDKLP